VSHGVNALYQPEPEKGTNGMNRHIPRTVAAGTPATLTIHQTGGVVNGEQYQFEDDPLFKVGEKCVLFLREYATHPARHEPGHRDVVTRAREVGSRQATDGGEFGDRPRMGRVLVHRLQRGAEPRVR